MQQFSGVDSERYQMVSHWCGRFDSLAGRLDRLEEVLSAAEDGENKIESRQELHNLNCLLYQTRIIYFVYEDRAQLVKIGMTRDLKKRLSGLQVSSAHPLVVIGHVRGPKELERLLHTAFQHDHVRGEWFKLSDPLLGAVEAGMDGGLSGILGYVKEMVDTMAEVA